ncbi:MAG: hypothetical protein II841_04925 [Bacteroidales bacterium]|nr:hypothetical protein [Bacteroidales bacterium]
MIIDLGKVAVTAAGNWNNARSYEALTMVVNDATTGGDGCGYVSLKNNIGVRPGTDATVWMKAVEAGSSIYELCVKHGTFEGTEAEFVAAYNASVQAALDAAASAAAAESATSEAETLRAAAETAREAAETERAEAETERAAAEDVREQRESERALAEDGRSRTFARQSAAMAAALESADESTVAANAAAGAATSAAAAANSAATATAQMNAGLIGLKVEDGELILVQNAETGTVESASMDGDGMITLEFEV